MQRAGGSHAVESLCEASEHLQGIRIGLGYCRVTSEHLQGIGIGLGYCRVTSEHLQGIRIGLGYCWVKLG